MKKFNYLSIIAGAALLTACASDAPDAPNTTPPTEEGQKYVSISIATPAATRADEVIAGTKNANWIENSIKEVVFQIWSGYNAEDPITLRTTNIVQTENSTQATAYFNVPQSTFDALKSDSFSRDPEVYLVCNPTSGVSGRLADDDHVVGPAPYGSTEGSFMMSGWVQGVERTDYSSNRDGSTIEDSWHLLESPITVERVMARCDIHDLKTKSWDGAFSMHFSDLSYATSTYAVGAQYYVFPHYKLNYDGAVNIGTYELDNTYFEGHFPYEYYQIKRPVSPDLKSMHFSTQSGDYTWYEFPRTNTHLAKDAVRKLEDVTFLVFKVRMEYTGVGDYIFADRRSFDEAPEIWVYRGCLIGDSPASLKNYHFAPADIGFTDETVHSIYYAAKQACGSDDEAALRAELTKEKYQKDGLHRFTPEGDGNYYCYYWKAIQDAEDDCHDAQKYAVVRNHLYDIKINSIRFIGYPGEYVPTDIVPTYEDNYFDISIQVAPWQLRNNHFNF